MNILFLTLVKIKDSNQQSIYTDLLKEFAVRGHNVYIVTPVEKKDSTPTQYSFENNIGLLKVQIGNYFNTNKYEKGLTLISLENRYLAAIRKFLKGIKFDLVLYSTPPITFSKVIKAIKKRDSAASYLMLKDIFPQNAVDLNMMSDKGPVYRYFRRKEKALYAYSDYIGCMSEQNKRYLLEHNKNIDAAKVEICPNCTKIEDRKPRSETIRKDLGLPEDETVFLYGGNLGAPQGIDFIIRCLEKNEETSSGYILIVGQGSEYEKLHNWFTEHKPVHSKLINFLPREEYNKIVGSCDVGLIFLDHRFTIPNFPSRLLSYMQAGIPVLAATDANTDVGTVIESGGFGHWSESNDEDRFVSMMEKFNDPEKRSIMGDNGRKYLSDHYSSEKAYEIINAHFR